MERDGRLGRGAFLAGNTNVLTFFCGPHDFAGLVHSTLAEREAALASFDPVDHLDQWPVLALRYLPVEGWDPVRDEPRFERLLRELDAISGR